MKLFISNICIFNGKWEVSQSCLLIIMGMYWYYVREIKYGDNSNDGVGGLVGGVVGVVGGGE